MIEEAELTKQDQISHLMAEIERITPFIQPSLNYGGNTHDMEDIAEGVFTGRYQLWAADDAAVVTELIEYPNCNHLHVFLSGGNRDTIEDMRLSLERFAKYMGCAAMTMVGRRGWARRLRAEGYHETMSTVVKRLTDVEEKS